MNKEKKEPPIVLEEGKSFEVVESILHKKKSENLRERWRRVLERAKHYSSEAKRNAKQHFDRFWDEWERVTKKYLFDPVLWLADDGMEKFGGFGMKKMIAGLDCVKKWKDVSVQWGDDRIIQVLKWVDEFQKFGKKKIKEEIGLHKELLVVIGAQSRQAAERVADDINNGAQWVKQVGAEQSQRLLNDLVYLNNIAILGMRKTPSEVAESVRENVENVAELTRRNFRNIVIVALVGVAGVGGYYGVKKIRGSGEKPKLSAQPFVPDSAVAPADSAVGFEFAELDSIPVISDSVGVGPLEYGKPSTIEKKFELISSAVDFDYEKTDPTVRGALMEDVRAILWGTGRWTKAELKNMLDSTAYGLYKTGNIFRDALAGNSELFDPALQLVPDAPATGGYYFLNTAYCRSAYDGANDGDRFEK